MGAGRDPGRADLTSAPAAGDRWLLDRLRAAACAAVAAATRGSSAADLDRRADAAALDVLVSAGLSVLSEESGTHGTGSAPLVVLDPLDGTTNRARGLPWHGASIAAVDGHGVRAAVVVDASSGASYEAARGQGARRDGVAIGVASPAPGADLLVATAHGTDAAAGVWARTLGATALELCAVAEGVLDGLVAGPDDGVAPWDYLAGLLLVVEAGGHVVGWDRVRASGHQVCGLERLVVATDPEVAARLARWRQPAG